jgi:heme O synthase-like polyprenyltransferase
MRPIPRGVVPPLEALAIGILLAVVSVAALAIKVNVLAAALLALTIAIYVPLYTMVLKRSTPMNIVIGGAAGALPPVIGWAAAMNAANAGFLWRAFALYRLRDGEESARRKAAMGLFGFSILYLFVLFAAMLAEVLLRGRV